jgi:hypothetical protein
MPAVASTQQSEVPTRSTNMTVSIPLNTGTVGANVSRIQMRLPLDITFEDFFSRACAKMNLDPSEAELGYKFNLDRARDDPNQLSSETQLREAMERGEKLLIRTRTRKIILEIHNLVSILFIFCFLLLTFQLHSERQPRQHLQAAGAMMKLAWTAKTHQPQSALQPSSAS